MVKEHLSGYQERDYEVVDYQMYSLGELDLWFRGPEVGSLETGKYGVCIGAAQTFGCFCEKAFPIILQEEFNLPMLNLGYGGAGPYFYLKHQKLLDYINRAKFVIVQVMSGRSESNSLFYSGGLELLTRRFDGVKLGADSAYKAVLEGNYIWRKVPIGQQYVRTVTRIFGGMVAMKLVAETRSNWINNYRSLLSQITVPKILFWFSKRQPNYKTKYTNLSALFNDFPQLVTSSMVETIRDVSDEYVECVSKRGSPQRLFSRFTGEPVKINPALDRKDFSGQEWTHNSYYPSPEMHIDAAQALEPFCSKYLS